MTAQNLLQNASRQLRKSLLSLRAKFNHFIDQQYPQKFIKKLRLFWAQLKIQFGQLNTWLHQYAALAIKNTLSVIHTGMLHTLRLFNSSRKLANSLAKSTAFYADKSLDIIDKRTLQIQNRLSAATNKLSTTISSLLARQKQWLLKGFHRVSQSRPAQKLKQYALLIRLDKPIGILLLLWPTLIALWIAAGGWPDNEVLFVFVAGVFLMRSAGCAINDYADRHIDCKVTRTKDRPLTSGKITEKEALIVFAVLCLTAFGLVLLMNPLTIIMSLIGLVLAASYPFMKRHHYLPQVHLGAAFGWAVPMAYVAQTNELSPVAWLLFIATVLWATAYDTMYAMVDREDDLKIGVKSTAILFESADKLIIGIIQATLILCLIMIGKNAELGGFYFAGLLTASGLAIWQQYLIRHREPAACFQAFLNNNWFGLVLFTGVFLEYQIGGITS